MFKFLQITNTSKSIRVICNPFEQSNIEDVLDSDKCNFLIGSAARTGASSMAINSKFDCKYILDFDDISFVQANELNIHHYEQITWLKQQSISADIIFKNKSRLIVIAGGISPDSLEWESSRQDVQVSVLEKINEFGQASASGRSWQEVYDGRFGYVCSANFGTDRSVKLFNHSCAMTIGDNKRSIIDFNEFGIEKIFYG